MSPTVLVIDDNPKIKESLELAFPEYNFIGASNGEDGLKLLRKPHEIDLVLLDYRMSGLDGMAVLQEIRRMEARVGVMLLTGFGSKELAIEALRRHADDFVEKPFSIDEIKLKLENYFEKSAEQQKSSGLSRDPMQRVLKFVERNFSSDLTLQDVAEKASLSPKYLSRKFKNQMRQTFSDYKIRLRVDQAKKLLRDTAFSIAQVAYKVGYENPESFMKVFKRIAGCTPTEYRKRSSTKLETGQG